MSAPEIEEAQSRRRARRLRRRRERLFGRMLAYLSLAVVILTVIAALWDVPSEEVRRVMEEKIGSVYNRKVTIDGATFNLIGGVRLRGLRIHNPPGFSGPYLLDAPEAEVLVQLLPFGRDRLQPRRFTLPGAVVRIERNADGVWNIANLTRLPPEPRPKYHATVEIANGRLEYVDRGVGPPGGEGFHGVLRDFDGAYLIHSSPTELTSIFSLTNEEIDGTDGTRIDVGSKTHRLEDRTELHLFIRNLDLDRFRPFYHWLPEFEVLGGRGDLEADAEFFTGSARWRSSLRLEGIRARHPRSGRAWEDGALDVAFDVTLHDTRIEIHRAEAAGGGTRLEMRGAVSNRQAETVSDTFVIDLGGARLEEIVFFAGDPRLAAAGPAAGTYRYRREGEAARYEIDLEATAAEVSYGAFFRKPAGVPAAARIEGSPGGGFDRIEARVGGSRVLLLPGEGGVRLVGEDVLLADVRAFVLASPLHRWPEAVAEGTADADLLFRPLEAEGLEVTGTVDLAEADLDLGDAVLKPRGVPASARLRVRSRGDEIRLDPLDLRLGASEFSVRGLVRGPAVDLEIAADAARFDDVRAYLPAVPLRSLHPFRGRGAFAGRFRYRTEDGEAFAFEGEADLAASGLRVGEVLDKPAGVPAAFAIGGRRTASGVAFETGSVSIAGSTLLFQGDVGETEGRFRIFGTSIDLGRLKGLLTQQWVRDFSLLRVEGPAIARAVVGHRETGWDVLGRVDLTPARVEYGETFAKPAGVPMAADFEFDVWPERVDLKNLDVKLGGSLAYMRGAIRRGDTMTLDLRAVADLDAAEVRHLVPGLERYRIMGSPVPRVLRTMSDARGRFQIEFDVKGPASSPDVVVAVRKAFFEAMHNALENHVQAIFRVLPIAPTRSDR